MHFWIFGIRFSQFGVVCKTVYSITHSTNSYEFCIRISKCCMKMNLSNRKQWQTNSTEEIDNALKYQQKKNDKYIANEKHS